MASNQETGDTVIASQDTQSAKSKRGKVILKGLTRRKAKGVKNIVLFNNLGQPYGDVASEMQSYIGILARTEVKITYKDWHNMPIEVKNTIREYMNVSASFLSLIDHLLGLKLVKESQKFNIISYLFNS